MFTTTCLRKALPKIFSKPCDARLMKSAVAIASSRNNAAGRYLSYSRVVPGQVSPSYQRITEVMEKDIECPSYARDSSNIPVMDNYGPILKDNELTLMKEACEKAAEVLNFAGSLVKAGTTTDEIDQLVYHYVVEQKKCYPSPLNYSGFPKCICTSINDVIVHGIPDDRPLVDGDIINIDVSVYVKGFHGDNSRTFLVGNVDEKGRKLVHTTEKALMEAIGICKPGVPFKEIGAIIHDIADEAGYSTVQEYTGHGIGHNFHTLPFILHFRNDMPGNMLPGMIFTIEPMLCEGSTESIKWDDNWTVATKDGFRSAQAEHTIRISEEGDAEILTRAIGF